jgi:hypothetical protein
VRHSLASVRLACVRHAASVHPEPGSNSPYSLGSCLSVFTHYSAVKLRIFETKQVALNHSLAIDTNTTNLTLTCQDFIYKSLKSELRARRGASTMVF